ncbi:putative Heterokaryon incompatibility domain-containing protein [Seiridium cardinale]|uniref:Heterokaryon incompatibility domain-containing protein n=1 Tax=Seiridium cardinale TaxID=138064 RepID=A0ABR2XG75_9PEZI
MSWAASRVTTRPEDMAYCLLGLFDINMSMLYGEGERAFIRLQEAICGQTNDPSLFAWTAAPAASEFGEQSNKLRPRSATTSI